MERKDYALKTIRSMASIAKLENDDIEMRCTVDAQEMFWALAELFGEERINFTPEAGLWLEEEYYRIRDNKKVSVNESSV